MHIILRNVRLCCFFFISFDDKLKCTPTRHGLHSYYWICGGESVLIGLYIRLCYKLLHSSSHDMSSSLLVFIIKPRALSKLGFPDLTERFAVDLEIKKGLDLD